MGQHKHNPNCKLAREGKLPPKQRKKGKRELERELFALCSGYIGKQFMDAYSTMNREETILNAYMERDGER